MANLSSLSPSGDVHEDDDDDTVVDVDDDGDDDDNDDVDSDDNDGKENKRTTKASIADNHNDAGCDKPGKCNADDENDKDDDADDEDDDVYVNMCGAMMVTMAV